jgi:preprotein translocase subunit SecE
MAKNQDVVQTKLRPRTPLKATAVAAGGVPVAQAPKKPFNPAQFLREVDVERRKVTWTSWKETWITSVMVGMLVLATAAFFFGADALLSVAESFLLKLANAE